MAIVENAAIEPTGESGAALVVNASSAQSVLLPEGISLSKADFTKSGPDLTIEAVDGTTVIVRDFYASDSLPELLFNGGEKHISGDLAAHLAGPEAPGQYAQTGAVASAEPIGTVESIGGDVTATRADGTEVTLDIGDPVYQGDILASQSNSGIGIILADDTTFSMGPDGRMVLDEMIYDPGTQEGSLAISVLEGVFTFVSGQVAKNDPDAMVLETPVATIGIRGTQLGLDVPADGPMNAYMLEEGDGFVGEATFSGNGWVSVLNLGSQGLSVTSLNIAPPPPVLASINEILARLGGAFGFLPDTGNANTYGVAPQGRTAADDLDDLDTAAGGDDDGGDGGAGGPPPGAPIPPTQTFGFDPITSGIAPIATDPLAGAEDDVVADDEPPEELPVEEEVEVVLGEGYEGYNPVSGSESGDTLSGTAGSDIMTGLGGNDSLLGNDGNDALFGGAGNDSLRGGAGDDDLFGEDGDDLLRGGAGDDLIDGGAGIDEVSYADFGTPVTVNLDTGTATDGGGGNDTINNVEDIFGGKGDDTLIGGSGGSLNGINNVIDGNDGDDLLFGGAGDDDLFGGNGDDTLAGGAPGGAFDGNDNYDGGSGTDTLNLTAITSDVTVTMDFSTDEGFSGMAEGTEIGADFFNNIENIATGAGNDVIIGDSGDNSLFGFGGNDTIDGRNGNDTLTGGEGNDDLDGGSGNDFLFGNEGVDTLDGGEGSDVLSGGTGNDTLTGGGNSPSQATDFFFFEAGGGSDTITDIGQYSDEMVFIGYDVEDAVFTQGDGVTTFDKFTFTNGNGSVDVTLEGNSDSEGEYTVTQSGTDVVVTYTPDT